MKTQFYYRRLLTILSILPLMFIAVSCDEIKTETWDKVYTVPPIYLPEFVFETSDGNILSGGGTTSKSSSIPETCIIVLTDSLGTIRWSKTFDQVYNTLSKVPIVVREVSNGFLIAHFNYDDLSLFLTILDKTGEQIDSWTVQTDFVRIRTFQFGDESVLISGWTICDRYSINNPSQCLMYSNESTVRLSLTGDLVWSYDDSSNVITPTRDGGAAIITADQQSDTKSYGVINKINQDGEFEWSTTVKTGLLIMNDYCYPEIIHETEGGGFVYAAYYGHSYERKYGTMISKISATGRITKTIYSKDLFVKALRQNPDGKYILTGIKSSYYVPSNDVVIDGVFIRKLTSGLFLDWHRENPVTETDPWKMTYDTVETDDGGYLCSGSKTTGKYWIMKVDPSGRLESNVEESLP